MKKIIVLILIFAVFLLIIIFGILFTVKAVNGQGALQVTSIPESKIYLNGRYIGQTPYPRVDGQNTFPTGDYTLKLVPVDESFPEYQQKITINKLTLTVVEHTFGPQGKGTGSVISLSTLPSKTETQLLVLSFPDQAEVSVDSTIVGTTPLLLKALTVSDHKVKVKKPGYKEKIVPIKTPGGFKVQLLTTLGIGEDPVPTPTPTPQLTPTPTASASVTLTILTTPTGFLRVRDSNSVDGKEVGQVKPGEIYPSLQEIAGWYRIKLSTGIEGWISGEFVTKE